jgi:broad specificity phosphatase PhoE
MNIYLLRHGETSWNREERLQGITDVPLNGFGVRQSRRLVRWFTKTNVSAVITSPLRRARQTARILCEAPHRSILIDNRLREIDHGPWTGSKIRGIARRLPVEYATWRFSPDRLRLSAGETLEAVYRRSSAVLSELVVSKISGDVLVVSHGVTNALFVCAALGLPLSEVCKFSQGNGCVTVLKVNRRQITAVESEIDGAA